MRLFQRNEVYYISLKRNHRMSLGTKDRVLATQKAKLIFNEYEIIKLYRKVIEEQDKLIFEITKRRATLIDMLGGNCSLDQNEDGDGTSNRFKTEEQMQTAILPYIKQETDFYDYEQQKECSAGVLDVFGHCKNKAIIIEFKLGTIKENHLGQCLRYLNASDIRADELWLVGEKYDNKSKQVFKLFPNIKVYTLTFSNRIKRKLKLNS